VTAPVRIWLEISHHAAFRVGGWAYVRADEQAISGHAGGDRRIDLERAALVGLLAPLRATVARPVALYTASAGVLAIPARISAAQAGEQAPTENLDLWAEAMTALASGAVQLIRAAATAGTSGAFAAGWAEFARDKAKDKGAFTAPIPKPNLAKSGVPPF
jgi:hypothetical protein